MRFLGIESSCDETGVALYDADTGAIWHALHSQVAMHDDYGGVVPELASRDHIRRVLPLLEDVLAQAECDRSAIDAVAYTAGPGLAGALLVGASIASALAMALDRPSIPVHHLEGHLLSPLLAKPAPSFPFVALLVSGGHTQLMRVDGVGEYELLGETLDDAAGEAFDKSAKLLGMPYPGGPHLARMAQFGTASSFDLPRPMLHSPDLDFSFSGLKTAVLTQVRKLGGSNLCEQARSDLAAAVQEAIVDVLVAKSCKALRDTGLAQLVVAGGVGANARLRERLQTGLARLRATAYFPPLALCTDNGAMIAFAAAMRHQAGKLPRGAAAGKGSTDTEMSGTGERWAFPVHPRWPLAELAPS